VSTTVAQSVSDRVSESHPAEMYARICSRELSAGFESAPAEDGTALSEQRESRQRKNFFSFGMRYAPRNPPSEVAVRH